MNRAGVESVSIAGENKNLLLVIGVGIDSNHITEKLQRKVGHAEVVELRTVDAEEMAERELAGLVGEHAYRYHPSPSPSPYKHGVAARGLYYTGGYPQAVAGAQDVHYYTGGSYAPTTMGARDYYGGSGYPGQYQQQHDYLYYPAAANTHTVVHHEYSDDPNSCSIM